MGIRKLLIVVKGNYLGKITYSFIFLRSSVKSINIFMQQELEMSCDITWVVNRK
jgi:hypothetical protein